MGRVKTQEDIWDTVASLEGRVRRLENLQAMRFLIARDTSLRNVGGATQTEITTGLRLTVPPTTGTWEFAFEFQWEENIAAARLNLELWTVVSGTPSVVFDNARGGLSQPNTGRNIRGTWRAFIRAAEFGGAARDVTMMYSAPDGGTASIRGDVAPTMFAAIEHL